MSLQSCQVQSEIVISGDFNYINILLLQISFHSVDSSLQSVNSCFQIKSNRDQHLLYHSHASVNDHCKLNSYSLEIFRQNVF